MKKERAKNICFYATPEIRKVINDAAKAESRTISSFVVFAILEYLKKK